MKYFLDTEFIEYPHTIDLISIGIVCDTGKSTESFYKISSQFNGGNASKLVMDNVIRKLEPEEPRYNNNEIKWELIKFILKCEGLLEVDEHGSVITRPLYNWPVGRPKPQFYGYYGAYDWVVFCWLFGIMKNLPPAFPMFIRDIMQYMEMFGISKEEIKEAVPQVGGHNALADALWNLRAYNYIQQKAREQFGVVI